MVLVTVHAVADADPEWSTGGLESDLAAKATAVQLTHDISDAAARVVLCGLTFDLTRAPGRATLAARSIIDKQRSAARADCLGASGVERGVRPHSLA